MLVRLREREEGSAIVSVLIIMLVLTVSGLALAAIVQSTSSGLAGSRDTAQSRAAADAGLAAAVAEARRTGDPCAVGAHPGGTTVGLEYSVDVDCASDRVVFTVTGEGADGATTRTEAVFAASSGPTGMGADMIFFGDTTFSSEVITYALDDSLLSIVIPSGDFTCMAPIPANVVLAGDFETKGGCDVAGSVITGGIAAMATDTDTVRGSLSIAGAGTSTVRGSVGGDLDARDGVTFGWEGKTIGGDLSSGGTVKLGETHIDGSATLRSLSALYRQSGTIAGEVHEVPDLLPPPAPTFTKWFDYAYRLTDWQPYDGSTFTPRTLAASGSGADTCSAFNASPGTGWSSLGAQTAPTVLDARACTELTSNNGSTPVVELRNDLVLLAKSFDLTALTFRAAPGTSPRVWFIVEDTVDDDRVTCSGGAGNITINGTVMDTSLTAMAYTPCTIDVDGMDDDSWSGSFYGGRFDYGGGLDFYGAPIALPGMPSSPTSTTPPSDTVVMGDLISRRDVS